MIKPAIRTAIPKRRYRIGEFSVVVLGDIESADPIDYRYILASVVVGESEPGLYITAEHNRSGNTDGGKYAMRVIMRDGSEVIGSSDRWEDLDTFVADAIDNVITILDLKDEEVKRLM